MALLYNYVLAATESHAHRQELFLVALKSSRLGALLVVFALVLGFFGALQLLTTGTASATALACPAPATNVNDKVDLDWDNLQLVNPQGTQAKTVADLWDLGVKLPWKTKGAVKAGDFFTYDATVAEAGTGQPILRPTAERTFDVRSANGIVVGCGTWGTDGIVTVVFNENADSAAEWAGSVTTSAMVHYTGPAKENFQVQVGNKLVANKLNMVVKPTGEARYAKEGWLGLSDSEDGDENKAVMWRVILPAGDQSVTGASIVDEVPAGEDWSFDCATVTDYVKAHTFVVVDPTTPEGKRQSKDTSNGAFGAGSTVACTSQKVTVNFPTIPAHQSAIVEIPSRVEGAKRAADVSGKFTNTVNFNVPGKNVAPVTKVARFGAVADAFAHQTFSVIKKVDGELPESAKNLDYTLSITLKNDTDPSVNKTYQATVKAGKKYTYPGTLPLGTQVTVSEGDLPTADGITWNEAESRIFETAQGVSLKANNREATFTLSEDNVFVLTLNNKLAPTPTPTPSESPTPTPSPTPSESPTPTPTPTPSESPTPTPTPTPSESPTPTPTPTPSTPPAPRLAKTGADTTSLGFLAGLVTIAGVSLVIAQRRRG